jgi:hypothetical protein
MRKSPFIFWQFSQDLRVNETYKPVVERHRRTVSALLWERFWGMRGRKQGVGKSAYQVGDFLND